jgi:hypothetical protein
MKLSDLKQDAKNANKGTPRGRKVLASSLEQFGAGRSVLIDKDGRIIAGNKTVESASAAGLQDVIVVQTTGTQLVAVQRTDLSIDDLKARGLAVADNRSSEVGLEWDVDVLAEIATDVDLQPYFTDAELAGFIPSYSHETGADEKPEGRYKEQYGVIVICEDEAEQRKIYERLTEQGHKCKVVVT